MTPPEVPTLDYETTYWKSGLLRVAGVDEAGRGCWAGPVTAAAVILPASEGIQNALVGVRDSKKLTAKQREQLLSVIQEKSLYWGVGWATNVEIDAIGIVPATRLAMVRAITGSMPAPQALLIDAISLPDLEIPQQSMNFGDSISLSIAAASICAKVFRDRWMAQAGQMYSSYGFAQHKGYGTRQHRQALNRLGACPIHRMSFRPLRKES